MVFTHAPFIRFSVTLSRGYYNCCCSSHIDWSSIFFGKSTILLQIFQLPNHLIYSCLCFSCFLPSSILPFFINLLGFWVFLGYCDSFDHRKKKVSLKQPCPESKTNNAMKQQMIILLLMNPRLNTEAEHVQSASYSM